MARYQIISNMYHDLISFAGVFSDDKFLLLIKY